MEKTAYEVIQIDGSSWRIEENGVRSFLFAGADIALLVDTGFGSDDLKAVIGGLTDLPIMLVNTHADGDHFGCNKQFDKAFLHPDDFDRYTAKAGKDAAVEALLEGDVIGLGNRRFEVIHIPGHTPGSVALLDAENRVLISGDSVQAGMVFMFGPGRDIDAYIASMEKLLAMGDRFDTVYPSHGPFPVKAGILGGLISGARDVKNRKVPGMKAPYETDAMLYDVGVAKFLY